VCLKNPSDLVVSLAKHLNCLLFEKRESFNAFVLQAKSPSIPLLKKGGG
jgi:hypothetical protein